MDKKDIEQNKGILIEGPIPPKALMVAQSQGLTSDEIWGSYFPPNDDRNPNMGSHYLGLVTLTPGEVRGRIDKERSRVLNNDFQAPWSHELDSLVKADDAELDKLFEVGIGAVKQHELTHKKQQDLLEYQSLVLQAYWVINITKDNEGKSKVRESYQDLVLLAEVQALSRQCSAEEGNVDILRRFNIYWFSKTLKLFNGTVTKNYVPQIKGFDASSGKIDVQYGSKDISFFEDLFNSLRNKQDFEPKIANVYGLMSRALYLCEDPAETLNEIRTGKISVNEFQTRVVSGLNKMIIQKPEEIVKRGKVIFEQTEKPLRETVGKLRAML